MIESAREIIDVFGRYLSKPDRYVIDSCINLAKWHILFEAGTRLEYLNARRSFYIFKIDECPEVPIINIYTEGAETSTVNNNLFWKFTTKWDGVVEDIKVTGRPEKLESTVFYVDYVDSLTTPVLHWYSKVISDYKQLESTIQEAYVKVLELETV